MQFTQQSQRDRHAFRQPFHAFQGRDIAGHLGHVIDRHAGRELHFVREQIMKEDVPLDLRRQHRLLPDIGIEEYLPVRHDVRHAVQSADG